ncbi:MAG: VOC family protein [Polyangiaceae bacterium]
MIDHTGFNVSDLTKSRAFYDAALAPLAIALMVVPSSTPEVGGARLMASRPGLDFWLAQGEPQTPRVHLAFHAESRAAVDAFYQAAIAAGGRDNGPPGIRAAPPPNYYGAFVLDPDGYNVEACHDPASRARLTAALVAIALGACSSPCAPRRSTRGEPRSRTPRASSRG